jgi:hypothetical protein
LRAGLEYGALGFLAGGVLGPARELALAPMLGGMAAALIEAVALGVLLWLAARFVMARRLPDAPPGWRTRMAMAATALAVVLAGEAILGLVFTATGLAAQRAPRPTVEQAVGLPLFAWLAALPFLLRRGG